MVYEMQNNDEAVIQNLIAAGCSEQLIQQVISLQSEHKTEEILSLLSNQRKNLLDGVHAEERKIYCLDYLANKLKNSK